MDDKQKIAYLESQLDVLLSGYNEIKKLYDLLSYIPSQSDAVECINKINSVRKTTLDSYNRISERYGRDE